MQKDRLVMHRPTQPFRAHNATFYGRALRTKAAFNPGDDTWSAASPPLMPARIYLGPSRGSDETALFPEHCFIYHV